MKVQDVEDEVECKTFLLLGSDLADVLADSVPADAGDSLLSVHMALSELMGASGCCLDIVTKNMSGELDKFMDFERPLELREDPTGLWQCLEWSFWGGNNLGSPYEAGLRAGLWQISLKQEDYHTYSVFEMLTVQFAYLPLCVHRTKVYTRKAALGLEDFGNNYLNCAPTHLSYAIDHFIVAGASDRAQETWALMKSHHWQPIDWQSIHNTAIGYLPGVAHWPWWQAHPAVRPYIDFLERNFDLIALERPALDLHPNLQKDAFPATSRDKSWHKIEFWQAPDGLTAECQWTPLTCDALSSLGWVDAGDIVCRKLGWSIVEPGTRFAGHSGQSLRINVQVCVHGCEGAELHIDGQVVQYERGRAIAWQDGWRHEVRNRGTEPRWVFMITIPHPEYQLAWEASGARWPDAFQRLSGAWRLDGPYDRF